MKRFTTVAKVITATMCMCAVMTNGILACDMGGQSRYMFGNIVCVDSNNYTYINTADGNLWAMWNIPEYSRYKRVLVEINDNRTPDDVTDDYINNMWGVY